MIITQHQRTALKGSNPGQFEIRTIESCLQDDMAQASSLFYQSMHTVVWVLQGSGEIVIDINRYTIEDDYLYYIKPGQLLQLTLRQPCSGFLISFEKDFLDLFEKKSFHASGHLPDQYMRLPVLRVEKSRNIFLKNIAEKMLDEFTNAYDARSEIIASLLKIFMIYLGRQTSNTGNNSNTGSRPDISIFFFRLLEKHFMDKKFVKDYADILSVTPGYLNKIIKEITGLPVSYHIQQRIVLEAKRLALYEGDSLKEIAYSLGFCSPAHFSKFFKSCAGTNYSIFKKAALNVC